MPKLTSAQRLLIIKAKLENDYCVRGNPSTMKSLVRKGLAWWEQDFGWKYGGLLN